MSAPPMHLATRGEPLRLERVGGHSERADSTPAGGLHGNLPLEAALGAEPKLLARLARDAALEGLDPERALYLDIETTGLSGGAGTYPFLVALAGFERDAAGAREVVVWQGFMAGPGDERSMLQAVADRVAAAGSIVTFFGKSFDRHRLEDKMRHHGVEPPFQDLPHLDLYHPLRRLYGEALPDGKLQTCERALLGFEREDDLSGAFAPAAWFDFQAGRPHLLEQVFLHNYLDVLSLCSLTGHLGAALGEVDCAMAPERLAFARSRGLARLAADRRERPEQVRWIDAALGRVDAAAEDTERCEGLRSELLLERADAQRLARELELAASAYAQLESGSGTVAALAALELGKLERRRGKRADRARMLLSVERAQAELPKSEPGRLRARLQRDLEGLREALARAAE